MSELTPQNIVAIAAIAIIGVTIIAISVCVTVATIFGPRLTKRKSEEEFD